MLFHPYLNILRYNIHLPGARCACALSGPGALHCRPNRFPASCYQFRAARVRVSASVRVAVGLRLGVTYENVTLGNVTMSHRTREARRMPCVSLPLNYDRSAARSTRELVHSLQMYCKLLSFHWRFFAAAPTKRFVPLPTTPPNSRRLSSPPPYFIGSAPPVPRARTPRPDRRLCLFRPRQGGGGCKSAKNSAGKRYNQNVLTARSAQAVVTLRATLRTYSSILRQDKRLYDEKLMSVLNLRDEVVAINEKVVLRAEDLLSWLCSGEGWRWGLRAVCRDTCAPPATPGAGAGAASTAPLHCSKLDFSDVEKEKNALKDEKDAPGVVVFSYPRYCRYRALLRRLDGIQAAWLRDSLVAALGGYAAPTHNTRILYCKETFEYPELEGHEFVCNHLAPRLKGRPRGRRRKRSRSADRDRDRDSSDSGHRTPPPAPPAEPQTPRRLSLRNGGDSKNSDEDYEDEGAACVSAEADDRAFLVQLKAFYKARSTTLNISHSLKDRHTICSLNDTFACLIVSLRALYHAVSKRGGYAAVCRERGWRRIHAALVRRPPSPTSAGRTRRDYESVTLRDHHSSATQTPQVDVRVDVSHQKIPQLKTHNNTSNISTLRYNVVRTEFRDSRLLLPFENHERRNGAKLTNGTDKQLTTPDKSNDLIETIDIAESPLREVETKLEEVKKRLRTPSPEKRADSPRSVYDFTDSKDDLNITTKPAAELNQEFLDSLPKPEAMEEEKNDAPIKISVKPVEKLIDSKPPAIIDKPLMKLAGHPLTDYLNSYVDTRYADEDLSSIVAEIAAKMNLNSHSVLAELAGQQPLSESSNVFLAQIAQKLNLGKPVSCVRSDASLGGGALAQLSSLGDKYATLPNGPHQNGVLSTGGEQKSRPVGRSSLRSVRVKPARASAPPAPLNLVPGAGAVLGPVPVPVSAPAPAPARTTPVPPLRPDSASCSPPSVFNMPPPQVTSTNHDHSDDEIVEVPYKPKTPEIIDLDEYPESPQAAKKKKLDILKERGLEVTAVPNNWSAPAAAPANLLTSHAAMLGLNPAMQHQIITQAQLFQMYNMMPPNYANGIQPPKVIQGKGIFGSSGPEKTVYGNPKDPFMPPPHILQGTPIKPARAVLTTTPTPAPAPDILDLTCKTSHTPPVQKPAVEIVRVPNVPSSSPKIGTTPQNLSKNYTLLDGKAVVGSNLEITLVSPKQNQAKPPRPPQKRSSNGKFMSNKTPTPPKEYKNFPQSHSPRATNQDRKVSNIVVPTYQINSREEANTATTAAAKSQPPSNLVDLSKMQPQGMSPYMDPSIYMTALYSSLAGQMDPRQLALYRELMAGQFRGYPNLLNMGVGSTPTTKN
ncbi:AT-rich interactive domain-containing protein 5B [Eumeta japonica]|uniref:AT-rich interactive domain-containing protein 5B n=1 Tax=Eumeta variegata TaxID=151549 RepID=A0A4C1XL43_EUMVA|nr:AT-rich interactive domain-containing protein 5B [Eumeta japonica]